MILLALVLLREAPHPLLDPQELLHVMAKLMGHNIGLGKVASVAAEALELLPEGQIDVDLLILGTIERARGGLRRPASRAGYVAVENQLGVAVLAAVGGEDLCPRVLSVIEHEADEMCIAL